MKDTLNRTNGLKTNFNDLKPSPRKFEIQNIPQRFFQRLNQNCQLSWKCVLQIVVPSR